jgi:hypothetical protein
MENDLGKLARSLNKIGLKKESREIMSILKIAQKSRYPIHVDRYKQTMGELSYYLNDASKGLGGNFIRKFLSTNRDPIAMNSDIGLLFVSARQWYGGEYFEGHKETLIRKVKEIRTGLRILANNEDMSDKGDACMPSRYVNYCGLSKEEVTRRVADLMSMLSNDINQEIKDL